MSFEKARFQKHLSASILNKNTSTSSFNRLIIDESERDIDWAHSHGKNDAALCVLHSPQYTPKLASVSELLSGIAEKTKGSSGEMARAAISANKLTACVR